MAKTLACRIVIYVITLSSLVTANAVGLQPAFAAAETTTTRDDQTEITLSLYQHDLALIKDTRQIMLRHGVNHLVWQEIAAKIKPQTAWISHLIQPGQLLASSRRCAQRGQRQPHALIATALNCS